MALKSKPLDQVRADIPVAAAAQDETVRINLNVSKTTRNEWKSAAITLDKSLTELIQKSVDEFIKNNLK